MDEQIIEKLHGALLELMIEFDRICRKNNIDYTLSFGTLLGAVRHKGFIPWDDDVDIMLTRENFDKFCSIAQSESTEDFFFQSYETDAPYHYNLARLRRNNTALIYDKWKDAGFHQGMYIDIYPIDNVAPTSFLWFIQKWQIAFYTLVRATRNKVIFFSHNMGKLNSAMYTLFGMFPRERCRRAEYRAITRYDKIKTELCGVLCEGGTLIHMPRDMRPFPSEYFDGYEEIEFEGHSFMTVRRKDEILRHWYNDYMQLPPEEDRVLTHHPLVCDTAKSYAEYLKDWGVAKQ